MNCRECAIRRSPPNTDAMIREAELKPPSSQAALRIERKTIKFSALLRPHWGSLVIAFVAVLGESATDLLEPWPLKIVFDNVLGGKKLAPWLASIISTVAGHDRLTVLEFVVIAVLVIAVVGAVSTYCEKYITSSVAQWVSHDLRRTLYHHIQRLSLSYHDQKRTGDLISRITGDIDSVQDFISSALLGLVVNVLTLVGMLAVMFYLDWRFTLIALSVAPVLFIVAYTFTRRIKKAARDVRKKEGEIASVASEVLSSIRVVKAFTREDYEQERFEQQSLDTVETSLRARSLKARLAPMVEVIVAAGTALVLWYGVRLVLAGTITAGSLLIFLLYLGKMYKPMRELSKMTDTFSKTVVGFERIREVVEMEREVR